METIESDGNGGMQQPSSSDSGRTRVFRKRYLEQVLKTDLRGVKSIAIQDDENIIHRVEIQSSEENLLAGRTRNISPKEKKSLQLKFIGELPDTLQTSEVFKSKNGECLKVAIVDPETGEPMDYVPESCAEVEIVILEGDHNVTLENFERRIIKTGEKKKPHFVKRIFITLVKGVGYLIDVKLGQDSVWTNKCKCRLGAKIGQNLYAWTPLFEVIDNRQKDTNKHYPPLLSSEVWRLKHIGKDGKPLKRLKEKNIETVSDFLFWLNVDSEGLKQILLGSGSKWKTIVEHANQTCIPDDKIYSHKSSIEPQTSVVYSVAGKLKGVINESYFDPIDNLSADKKVHAYKLLRSVLEGSAFGERYNTPFDVEAFPPYISSLEITASTNSSLQPLSDHIYQAPERGSSSQNIDPNDWCDSGPPHSHVSEEVGELFNPADLDHETPLLSDEVSRLVNICKDGEIHKRLHVNRINTVEEFLIQLLRDEEEIRQIVSLEREEWEATVSNAAQACSTGDRTYCYTSLKLNKGVVFNLLGDVLGLLSCDKHFFPTSTLSEHDKREARELLASARKNWGDVVPYNEADRLHYQPSFSSGSIIPFDSADQECYDAFLHLSPNPMFLYHENTWDLYSAHGEFCEGVEELQHYGAYVEAPVVLTRTNSREMVDSDAEQFLGLLKILEEEFESMVLKIVRRVVKPLVIAIVKQEIVPIAEDLFRRVVKEEIQPLKEKRLADGTRNDFLKERTLQLMFSDELSDTVQTSTELRSKYNEFLELALVDSTGKTVDCGTESSAKVENLLRKWR